MSGSGISWAICKSAPCCRQTTTPAPHHSWESLKKKKNPGALGTCPVCPLVKTALQRVNVIDLQLCSGVGGERSSEAWARRRPRYHDNRCCSRPGLTGIMPACQWLPRAMSRSRHAARVGSQQPPGRQQQRHHGQLTSQLHAQRDVCWPTLFTLDQGWANFLYGGPHWKFYCCRRAAYIFCLLKLQFSTYENMN